MRIPASVSALALALIVLATNVLAQAPGTIIPGSPADRSHPTIIPGSPADRSHPIFIPDSPAGRYTGAPAAAAALDSCYRKWSPAKRVSPQTWNESCRRRLGR